MEKMETRDCKFLDKMTTLPTPEKQPWVREMETPTSAAACARESLMPSPTYDDQYCILSYEWVLPSQRNGLYVASL